MRLRWFVLRERLICRSFGCTSLFARWFQWPSRVCTALIAPRPPEDT